MLSPLTVSVLFAGRLSQRHPHRRHRQGLEQHPCDYSASARTDASTTSFVVLCAGKGGLSVSAVSWLFHVVRCEFTNDVICLASEQRRHFALCFGAVVGAHCVCSPFFFFFYLYPFYFSISFLVFFGASSLFTVLERRLFRHNLKVKIPPAPLFCGGWWFSRSPNGWLKLATGSRGR